MLEIEPDRLGLLPREALGVAAIIVPWNAPIGLLFRSLAAALAAGCTVVIKPHPLTSLTSAAVLQAVMANGALPPGVVNVVHEAADAAAKAMVASPDVDVISYTGSTAVGKRIMAAGAATLKRLNLELGGSTPCIIYADADLPKAVSALVAAGMIFSGQQCVAASRILVHRSRVEEAVDLFRGRLAKVVVGRGCDTGVDMGPLIDHANRDRVAAMVARAGELNEIVLKGADLAAPHDKGAFLSPSLVRVRDRGSEIANEEVFGPVLSIDSFDDEEEAISQADRTRLGLAASVWSQNLKRAQRTALRLRTGTVWINSHGRFSPELEVGGYKESGLGRLFGQQGLDDFLQTKHISWDLEEDEA